jgi:hypothetical protein
MIVNILFPFCEPHSCLQIHQHTNTNTLEQTQATDSFFQAKEEIAHVQPPTALGQQQVCTTVAQQCLGIFYFA